MLLTCVMTLANVPHPFQLKVKIELLKHSYFFSNMLVYIL